jgi:DNA end-binding protein Ku
VEFRRWAGDLAAGARSHGALERTLASVKAGADPREDGGEERSEDRDELERLSQEELYKRAPKAKIAGRTKMSKEQLVDALSGE